MKMQDKIKAFDARAEKLKQKLEQITIARENAKNEEKRRSAWEKKAFAIIKGFYPTSIELIEKSLLDAIKNERRVTTEQAAEGYNE